MTHDELDPVDAAAEFVVVGVALEMAVPPGYSVENLPTVTVVAVPRQELSDDAVML